MNRLSPSQIVGIIIAVIYGSILAFYITNPGLFNKLWIIVKYNPTFWISNCIGLGYAIFRWRRNPKQFMLIEVPIQVITTFIGLLLFFTLFFYTATDLKDKELWNGYVVRAEYWEQWTEHVEKQCCDTECDSDGNNCHDTNCHDCSYNVYHPPEWKIFTNVREEVGIDAGVYQHYVRHFGDEHEDFVFHMNQISVGDGNMFYSDYKGEPDKKVPAATEHRFVNYLKASQSIRKRTGGNTEGFEKFLLPYPQVYPSQFGPIEVNRVLNAETKTPATWIQRVDKLMDLALADLGKTKEVNSLVYLVATSDQSFLHALEEHWVMGKKNDVIVIIGAPDFPKIAWVAVIAWTNVEEFKVELRDNVAKLQTLDGKEEALVNVIASQIAKPPENGGFKRQRMRDLEYLASDVQLPIWATILVLLITGFLAWLTSWALEHNSVQEVVFRNRRYDR